jgi:FkbM family methyltransferase
MGLLQVLDAIQRHPINRGQRLRAAARFAAWQLRSRVSHGPHVHQWIGGAKFLVRRGETGLTGNVYMGLHEFEDMGFLLHVLRPGDVLADVGANAGSYTLLAAVVCGSTVHAFEPVPETFRRLEANVALNAIESRVRRHNVAVGAEPGELAFTTSLDTMNHALGPGDVDEGAVRSRVVTLDDAMNGEHPTALKIDVERFESDVLRGATECLRDPALHSAVIETLAGDPAVADAMHSAGFRRFTYNPMTRTLRRDDEGKAGGNNSLFIRDEALVRDRIASARHIKVLGQLV